MLTRNAYINHIKEDEHKLVKLFHVFRESIQYPPLGVNFKELQIGSQHFVDHFVMQVATDCQELKAIIFTNAYD